MLKKITIALAGNPNSGKTTVFNNLTGSRQHVGNYPGVTVEKKEGYLKYKDYEIKVVDLPGTYSLTAYSLDELVARNFLIEEKPDVVIDIVDTSNLERNLYLTTQLMELGLPLVLAFNMYDIAEKQGFNIDKDMLSHFLGCPIVFTVATKKKGMQELLDRAISLFESKQSANADLLNYGREIQEEIAKIEKVVSKETNLGRKFPLRWLAVKLLENDRDIVEKIKASVYGEEILEQVKKSSRHLQVVLGDRPEALLADRRYGFISGACVEAIKRDYEARHNISDKIDNILLNKILSLPIFLGLMWLVFKFVFQFSEPLMRGIEIFQGWLAGFIGGFLPEGSAVQSLVVEGIIGGIGSVLVFTPIIFLLFFAMAILEDSGYMARAAFIMDRLMHKIGLHGRSFIPMLLGFGCNVPAIMAVRSIEDRRDRIVTILINPFMSCGARLPIYTLFIGAFFPEKIAGNILFSLYFLGILVAVAMAKVFRKYIFKGQSAPFVMELPPYRMPTFRGLLVHTWERGVLYFKKAGTVIFAGCVIMWCLSHFPYKPQDSKNCGRLSQQAAVSQKQSSQQEIFWLEQEKERLEKSYAGRIGKAIAPVFKPLGFGDWKVAVSLIGGIAAKEIVVSTLATLHSIDASKGWQSLRESLRKKTDAQGRPFFTPLSAYSLMVFILLYIPCLATIAVVKKETNSCFWASFVVFYTTAIAWAVSFVVYNLGMFFRIGV